MLKFMIYLFVPKKMFSRATLLEEHTEKLNMFELNIVCI